MLLINLSFVYEYFMVYDRHIETLHLAKFFCEKFMCNSHGDYQELHDFISDMIEENKEMYKKPLKEVGEIRKIFNTYMKQIGYV